MDANELNNQGLTEDGNQADVGPSQTEDEFEDGSSINQEAVNKRINKITFEKHEALRRSEDLEAENKKLKDQLAAKDAKDEDIKIPALPDAFDPQYEAKIAERDEAIRRKAEQEVAKKAAAKSKQTDAETFAKKLADDIQSNVNRMFDEGKKLGIEEIDLQRADKTVSTFVRDPSLAEFILAQKNSALLVKHLAENISELETISQMSPLNAASYLATKVIPKVGEASPRRSGAPDPLETLPHKKVDTKDPFLKGVQFE